MKEKVAEILRRVNRGSLSISIATEKIMELVEKKTSEAIDTERSWANFKPGEVSMVRCGFPSPQVHPFIIPKRVKGK